MATLLRSLPVPGLHHQLPTLTFASFATLAHLVSSLLTSWKIFFDVSPPSSNSEGVEPVLYILRCLRPLSIAGLPVMRPTSPRQHCAVRRDDLVVRLWSKLFHQSDRSTRGQESRLRWFEHAAA